MPYFVVAGNYSQFANYVKEKVNSVGSRLDYRYVDGPQDLRGYSDVRGVFVGTWYEKANITDILVHLHIANRDNEQSCEAIIKANSIVKKLKGMMP